MAQFRATIEGQRGEASRLGSKSSGIDARVNGWSGGVSVQGRYAEAHDQDVFNIYATRGSGHDGDADGLIGHVIDGKFTPSEALREQIIRDAAKHHGMSRAAVRNGTGFSRHARFVHVEAEAAEGEGEHG